MYPEEYTPLRGERFHGGYFSQPGSWQELSLRALVTFFGLVGKCGAGGVSPFFMGFAYFAEGVRASRRPRRIPRPHSRLSKGRIGPPFTRRDAGLGLPAGG